MLNNSTILVMRLTCLKLNYEKVVFPKEFHIPLDELYIPLVEKLSEDSQNCHSH